MTLAFWCVLVAGVLPIATVAIAKASPDFDNAAPRDWLARQSGLRQRADFAHRNHFEAFPFFAAAVLVATMAHASTGWVNLLAVAFIVLRVLYTGIYLAGYATLRSAVWTAGYACSVALFVVAAITG